MEAVRSIATFGARPEGSVQGWLATIARNRVTDEARAAGRCSRAVSGWWAIGTRNSLNGFGKLVRRLT